MVQLDPLHHIVYPRDYRAWALPWGLKDGDTRRRPRGSKRSWPVCREEFSCSHWPVPVAGERNCGCRVDGPLNLPQYYTSALSCGKGMDVGDYFVPSLVLSTTVCFLCTYHFHSGT
jgi:hypothetical protein